jgi:YHS domain-containing protein
MKPMSKLFAVIVTLALSLGVAHAEGAGQLKKVEAKYVCMINNKLFDKVQIPVKVAGKTYYGCCAMCKAKLEKSVQARTATDPVSKKTVDKATAVIGAKADGTVFYFESEKNMKLFR